MFALKRSIPRTFTRGFKTSTPAFLQAGDSIPATAVLEGSPGNSVNLADETAVGKSVIIGVPGAFSPACSASHVPGFIAKMNQFVTKGYDKFFVVAHNDVFVMKAWGASLDAPDQVRFIADHKGEFGKASDLLFDASKFFGNERYKRSAILVNNGKVVKTFVEPDNVSVDVSSAEKVIKEA
ncbi:hypothetical protein BABINDRAFT_40195 [Babjeviella inositovora NRRL Y-12698]|uniref:Thioredoxin domain-containing protein n=1 Tax=Babjeviella inositovora NRRL Y-12698 TaxID=984486 RepID=A0A1E3QK14_9ASCO|nr:uncharacterized protein BABINDRAFT_40195 [Babjeviella inositovora NRRL Y-12698]ODQ78036.1 hypothetical protein BABINDRAFT_40195 [Babjeviella inositovora NRRL Y-12698]